MTNSVWTPADLETLERMWLRGDTATVIAHAVRRTRNAVMGQAHRQGLPGRPSPIGVKSTKRVKAPSRPLATASERKIRAKLAAQPKAPEPVRLDRTRGCMWTDCDHAPWAFCSQPVVAGHSWCEAHKARVFQAGTASGPPKGRPHSHRDECEMPNPAKRRFSRAVDSKWGL